MYAKLFGQVVSSSLTQNETIEVRGVFFMLLAMADKDGNVVGTDESICRIMNVPAKTFLAAMQRLMTPDPDSQTLDNEGRRVLKLDEGKGYRVVNYRKYSAIGTDHHRREYFRLKKQESRMRARGEKVVSPKEPKAKPQEPVKAEDFKEGYNQQKVPEAVIQKTARLNAPEDLQEVLDAGLMTGVPEALCRKFYEYYDSTSLLGANGVKIWMKGSGNGDGALEPVTNWRMLLQKWKLKENERLFLEKETMSLTSSLTQPGDLGVVAYKENGET